jgi:MFS family permease
VDTTVEMTHSKAGNQRYVWIVIILLFFSTLINYFDRQVLTVNGPLIRSEFGLNHEQFGFLLSVFYYAYMLMHVPFGLLLDRYSTLRIFGAGMLMWSLAGATAGLATSLPFLIACRFGLGLFEAVNWPACTKITQLAVPREERPRANGVWNSGSMVANVIGPFIVVGITTQLSWRASFVFMGGLGILWVAVWFLVIRERRFLSVMAGDDSATLEVAPTISTGATWKGILRSRLFWGMLLINVIADPLYHFFPNWLPTYLIEEKGVRFGQGLSTLLAVVNLSMIAGINASGTIHGLLRRRVSMLSSYKIIVFASSILMTVVVLTNYTRVVWLAVLWVAIAAFAQGLITPLFFTFIQEISTTATATVFSVISAVGVLTAGGFIWLIGYLVARSGTFQLPMVLLGGIPILMLLLYFGVVFRDPAFRAVSLVPRRRVSCPAGSSRVE